MDSYISAKTQYISSATYPDTKYAYIHIGPSSSPNPPLIYLTHFRSTIDKVDPLFLSLLSRYRSVIIVDYAGHGKSTGKPATKASVSAAYIEDFLKVLGIKELDVLGFSMGGFIAQMLALNADPSVVKVRKLIIAGTTASAGSDLSRSKDPARVNEVAGAAVPDIETFQALFFPENEVGRKALEDWWVRIHERTKETAGEEISGWVSEGYLDGAVGLKAQVAVLAQWMDPETSQGRDGSYSRLRDFKIPVLVANGNVSLQ